MSKKLWGWKIIKDNVSTPDEDCYVKDKEYRDYQGGKFKYRLLDDDGNIYYYLYSDINPDEGYEEQVFAPLDWGQYFAGCAGIQYKYKETGEYKWL